MLYRGRLSVAWISWFRLTAVLLSVVIVLGCQTTLSLEEAKKVTAKFEGGFAPPPRTIKDITSFLDAQERRDLAELAKMRVKADKVPPATDDAGVLARFYFARGQTADNLGRAEQAVADYRTAVEYAGKASSSYTYLPDMLDKLTWQYGLSELNLGNFQRGVEAIKKSIELAYLRPEHKGSVAIRLCILAAIQAHGGEIAAAEDALDEARAVYSGRLAEAGRDQVWFKYGEAMVASAKGDLATAERLLRAAAADFAPFRDEVSTSRFSMRKSAGRTYNALLRDLADVLIAKGAYVEAEAKARQAVLQIMSLYGRYSGYSARTLALLARAISGQGRHAEAEQLAHAGIDVFETVGNKPESFPRGNARRVLADTLVAQNKWWAALAIYDGIEKDLADNRLTFEQYYAGNLNWAMALLKAGEITRARVTLASVLDRNKRLLGAKHYETAEATGFMAAVQTSEGQQRDALQNFASALPTLLSRSRQTQSESSSTSARDKRLGLVLESYIGLLADIRGTTLEKEVGVDVASEAFRLAEYLRGRSVQRALVASSVRVAAANPELADLARREQDAQKRVAILWGLLTDVMSRPEDQRNAAQTKGLRTRIDNLRGARATLMEEIEARFPDYAELINPKAATVERARANLRPGEALITTYTAEKRTYVWAVPHKGEVVFATAELGREDLADTVALLRSSLEPNAQVLDDIPDFDVAEAYDLYERLLKPVEAGWKDAKSLLVVAHGPLGYLPPSILPTVPVELAPESGALFSNHRDVPWLARSHAVTMLPSVASLTTLRGLPPGAPDRKAFAGFGDPLFSAEQAAQPVKVAAALTSRGLKTRGLPVRLRAMVKTAALDSAGLAQLPRLPDTAEELRSIAVALNADLTEDVFLGERANEDAVKTRDLFGYKVLAFATHGLVPGDLDGLMQPALALSAPDVAGVEGDGLLTMGEILGLRLDADWVVLSACNTGSGAGAGAEAVSGLGQAFFYAGTRALLVSNWPVETTSAKALTTDLFRRQSDNANLTRAEALRRTMLGLIDGGGYVDQKSGKTVFSYAHPIFWAPFSLIGEGGVGKPFS